MKRRARPVPAAGAHFDAGAPPRDDRDLDEIRVTLVLTEDQPGARERVVEVLARLLRRHEER